MPLYIHFSSQMVANYKTNWDYGWSKPQVSFLSQQKKLLHWDQYCICPHIQLQKGSIYGIFHLNLSAKKEICTLYTSRKPLQHLLATGVPSCEEPGSAHEQTSKFSREELPHPFKQRRDELRERNFFVSLTLWWRLLISVDSCAEWGWPDTLGSIQGVW